MVNARLIWYLETNKLIIEYQSGFRNQRSTIDDLIRLETFIGEASIKKEHLVEMGVPQVLKIDHTEIPIVEHYKYQGIIFDRKLSFIPHNKYLRTKCNKTIQLLRTIAHTNWRGSKETL